MATYNDIEIEVIINNNIADREREGERKIS